VGRVVFDVVAPQQLGVTVLAFLLGMLTMFSLGMLLAAVLSKASVANAVGSLVYFPLLFLAGLWTPGPIMPEVLREVGQFSPLGAVAQALTAGWFGTELPLLQLVVMAAWTAVLLPLAVKLFRWT
jgi:ABC-2 type transport system permease protein